MMKHPELQQTKKRVTLPPVLFRGDSRHPDDVLAAGGFISRGTNYGNILDHMLGKIHHDTGYISTTGSFEVAYKFAVSAAWAPFIPDCMWSAPSRLAWGWVYEIEPPNNLISLEAEARTNPQKRMTNFTKEWVAVRKINVENIIRATQYRRHFCTDDYGFVRETNQHSKRLLARWENPSYKQCALSYNPYNDPDSGWDDSVKLFDEHNDMPQADSAAAQERFRPTISHHFIAIALVWLVIKMVIATKIFCNPNSGTLVKMEATFGVHIAFTFVATVLSILQYIKASLFMVGGSFSVWQCSMLTFESITFYSIESPTTADMVKARLHLLLSITSVSAFLYVLFTARTPSGCFQRLRVYVFCLLLALACYVGSCFILLERFPDGTPSISTSFERINVFLICVTTVLVGHLGSCFFGKADPSHR